MSLYNAHYTSQDAIKVANDLTRWAYCGGMKSGVPLPVVAHSRGTLILRRTMTLMPREVRQCLHVYAFGPPVMLPNRMAERVVNVCARRDWIVGCLMTSNALNAARNGALSGYDIEWVGPAKSTKWYGWVSNLVGGLIDHSMLGDVYGKRYMELCKEHSLSNSCSPSYCAY